MQTWQACPQFPQESTVVPGWHWNWALLSTQPSPPQVAFGSPQVEPASDPPVVPPLVPPEVVPLPEVLPVVPPEVVPEGAVQAPAEQVSPALQQSASYSQDPRLPLQRQSPFFVEQSLLVQSESREQVAPTLLLPVVPPLVVPEEVVPEPLEVPEEVELEEEVPVLPPEVELEVVEEEVELEEVVVGSVPVEPPEVLPLEELVVVGSVPVELPEVVEEALVVATPVEPLEVVEALAVVLETVPVVPEVFSLPTGVASPQAPRTATSTATVVVVVFMASPHSLPRRYRMVKALSIEAKYLFSLVLL